MDDLLPLLLWVFAVVWMLSVCGICIVRSRFGTGERHPEVNPVSWNVVLAQMVSVLFAGIPFMVYLMASEELSPAFHDFYTDHLVIGAAIVIVLVFVELLLMGIQAHRAHFTESTAWSAAPRIPRRDACVCETRIYRYGLGLPYDGKPQSITISGRTFTAASVIDYDECVRTKSIRRQFRRVQFDVP